MKVHHTAVHGESLAGTDVECAYCGETFRKDVYEAKQYEHHFCPDKDCHSNWCSENLTGEDNPFWQGGNVIVECEWCGDELERYPAEIEDGKNYFCNQGECVAKYESEQYSGEGNPNWKGGEVSCAWCGEELDRDMNQIERSERHFCGDKDCKARWQSKHFSGENHPGWLGGYDSYYGASWPMQRLKARIRDQSRCQICGNTPLDVESTLVVHHITPMRKYKEAYEGAEIYERANRLDNLRTLCRSCHMEWEGLFVFPDVR